MSGYLKHKTNLFLGIAELNRMQKFLDDDGYRTILLKNSASFGVVKYEADPTFQNFKVVEDVTGSGNYKIDNESFAIDSTGSIIRQKPISGQAIPSDGVWYWVKIAHSYRTTEDGTVSIDTNGNLTGVGTKFTETLRGAPNFPSKINFINSSGNLLDYEIVDVLGDTTALLAGTSFATESSLSYQVVGTFTPGHVPSSSDKYPFQHDGCTLSLVAETVVDTPPTKVAGTEFYVARVKNIAGTLTIHDKRVEQYRTTAEFNLSNILKSANPLIGVEWAKWKNDATARDENLLQVGFGMRTTAWTLDAPNRAITFSTGALDGGRYKSTSQFSNDELNGWRVYFKDGSYAEIHKSEKQGTAIKCTVKEVNPSKLTTGDVLVVVPAVDQVELRAKPDGGVVVNVEKSQVFEASDGFGLIELAVPETTYSYVIEYRYLKGGEATEWLQIPSDTTNGYYDESSWDLDGNLDTTTNRKTYTSNSTTGFIELVRASDSYIDTINSLQTGDKFGYGAFELDNGAPELPFEVGVDYMVQRCKGVRGGGPMTVNHIIGLKSTSAVLGNTFTYIFDKGIDSAGFSLTFNDGYVDSATPGTPIKTFAPEDFDYPFLQDKSVVIRCTYNGASWEVYVVEEDPNRLGDIKMVSSIDTTNFPSGVATLGTKYQGWAICDGNNTTLDLRGKFIIGFDQSASPIPTDMSTAPPLLSNVLNYGAIGNKGGLRDVQLTSDESGVPAHTHSHTLSVDSVGNHTHSDTFSVTSSGSAHKHQIRANDEGTGGSNAPAVRRTKGSNDPNSWITVYTGSDTYSSGAGADGAHVHGLNGSVSGGGQHSHTLSGSITATTGQDATQSHENRPPYIVLGFIQRIKQS